MEGIRAGPLSTILDRMKPDVVKPAAVGDVLVKVRVIKTDGSETTLTMKRSEADNYVMGKNFGNISESHDGVITVRERAEPVKDESLANKREERAARKDMESAAEEIIAANWGQVGGEARRLPDGGLVPGAYAPGRKFDVGGYGQVGEQIFKDMVGNFKEATIGQGRMPTYAVADSIQAATMPRYDVGTIPALDEALTGAMSGYAYDPKTGSYVLKEEMPYGWIPNTRLTRAINPGSDQSKLWNDFLREIGADFLNGAKEGDPKWNTVNAWLSKNGATAKQLNASAAASGGRTVPLPDPAATVSAAKPAQRKTINGVTYVNKTGNPNDWETE
jgi:hypothetical protein